jgi:hypothetical protein
MKEAHDPTPYARTNDQLNCTLMTLRIGMDSEEQQQNVDGDL